MDVYVVYICEGLVKGDLSFEKPIGAYSSLEKAEMAANTDVEATFGRLLGRIRVSQQPPDIPDFQTRTYLDSEDSPYVQYLIFRFGLDDPPKPLDTGGILIG